MSSTHSWILGIVVFFGIFIVLVSATNTFTNESFNAGQYNSTIDGVNFALLTADHKCSDPRYEYNMVTGEKEKYNKARRDHLECDEGLGALSNQTCGLTSDTGIRGCAWNETVNENVWQWIWGTGTVSFVCDGYINATYYGVNTTAGGKRVALHENAGFWGNGYLRYRDPSPCNNVYVELNKTSCEVFSCSWEPYDFQEDMETPTSLLATIGMIFTFRYDWGMSGNMALLFNIIFVILPILILAISIYLLAHPLKG